MKFKFKVPNLLFPLSFKCIYVLLNTLLSLIMKLSIFSVQGWFLCFSSQWSLFPFPKPLVTADAQTVVRYENRMIFEESGTYLENLSADLQTPEIRSFKDQQNSMSVQPNYLNQHSIGHHIIPWNILSALLPTGTSLHQRYWPFPKPLAC